MVKDAWRKTALGRQTISPSTPGTAPLLASVPHWSPSLQSCRHDSGSATLSRPVLVSVSLLANDLSHTRSQGTARLQDAARLQKHATLPKTSTSSPSLFVLFSLCKRRLLVPLLVPVQEISCTTSSSEHDVLLYRFFFPCQDAFSHHHFFFLCTEVFRCKEVYHFLL